jgi:hypothetical protein
MVTMHTKNQSLLLWSVLLVPTVLLASSASQKADEPAETVEIDIEFTDVREQTYLFMEYYKTIELTPEQERIKLAALSELPAACCADNSAYTCCCVCNLSRTVWGLTAYLIAERNYDVKRVQAAVRQWIRFVNPEGFSGNSCYRGGCARSFQNNGCGGMDPGRVIW